MITYLPQWHENPEALFRELRGSLPFQERRISMYGKSLPMPRLISYHGDRPYHYSGQTHPPGTWTPALQQVRTQLERELTVPFNVCLVNLYRDGQDSVSPHADDEPGMGPIIASVSLGHPRRFLIQPKDKSEPPQEFKLGHGDLLVMGGNLQQTHYHWVPKTVKQVGERINLTFRVQM